MKNNSKALCMLFTEVEKNSQGKGKMNLQKLKKSAVALAMGTAMIFSMPVCAQTPQVAEQTEVAGDVEEAYLTISSARELKEFAKKVNNGNDYSGKIVKLTQDIVFDGNVNNFTPIAANGSVFQGTFDGCGYTISGIDVTDTNSYSYPFYHDDGEVGLFGNIGSAGVVKNVTVKDSQFTAKNVYTNGGGIAGRNSGIIDNCHNRDVTVSAGWTVGGIVGYNAGSIVNSSSTGGVSKFKGDGSGGGGIAGKNDGNIYNSCNFGKVIIEGDWDDYAGGIAGYSHSTQNCYNTGEVIFTEIMSNCGGIVGRVGDSDIVSNSYCSEESAEQNFASMTGIEKKNKALPASQMQTQEFVDQLNSNIGDNLDWLEWEIRSEESTFPLPVKRVNMSDCNISVNVAQVEYNGKEQKPNVVITYEEETLELDKDYTLSYQNNRNVGTATIVIKGLRRYMDGATVSFEITSRSIAKTAVTVASGKYVYDGKAKTPQVVVKDGSTTLQKDRDYTVKYENNTNAGTANVVISGKGNYTGSLARTFKIEKAEQNVLYNHSYKFAYGDAPVQLYLKKVTGDGQQTCSSSSTKVAKVDNKGKVTITGIGKAVITADFAETANYKPKTVQINVEVIPKKPTISSVKSSKAKTITVRWKKDKSVSGYIIQCSSSGSFSGSVKNITISKNSTCGKTIKGLKAGKRYYVRICAYKKVSGKKVKGDYSAVKSVKVKK